MNDPAAIADEAIKVLSRTLAGAEAAPNVAEARRYLGLGRTLVGHLSTALSAERLARVDRQREPALDAEAARIFSRLGVSAEDVAKAEALEQHRAVHAAAQATEAEEAMRCRLGLSLEEWSAAGEEGSR